MVFHHIPGRIIGKTWLFGHHITTEEIAEIDCNAILMISHVKLQIKWFRTVFLEIGLCDIPGLLHLSQHNITSFQRTIRVTHRVIVRGILAQTHKNSSLGRCQVLWFLTEIGVRCRFDAYRIMQEIEIIEIHGQNLVLRIVTFQLDSNHPLDGFLQQTLHHTVRGLRIKLFSQLLGYGRSTAGTLLS